MQHHEASKRELRGSIGLCSPRPGASEQATQATLSDLAGPDDAGGHELVDRLLQLGVRHHRLLRLLGVVLHVLEEHVDLRVVEDVLDLGVGHRVADLLLVHLSAAAGLLDLHDHLLAPVYALLVAGLDLETFLVGLQGLVVLLHEEVRGALAGVGLDELGVQLQALLQVLQGIRVRHQLRERGRSVGVDLGVLRVPLHALVVLGLGLDPLLLLEELVALFPVLLSLDGVHVALLLVLLLVPLDFPQGVPRRAVVVLGQGLVVVLDGLIVLFSLLVHGRHAVEDLRHLLEGGAARARGVHLVAPVEEVLADLNHLVVLPLAHLDEGRALVVVVRDVVRLLLDRLVVHLQGLLQLLLLVQLVALGLELVRLLLLRRALVGRRLVLLLLLLRRRRASIRGEPGLAHVAAGATLTHGADVDALHSHEDLEHAGVLVHHLHEHLLLHAGVAGPELQDHLQLLHQGRVLDVLRDLRVLRRGRRQRGRVHGHAHATATATATCAGDLVLGVGSLAEALLEGRVLGRQLEARLVGVDGVVVLPEEVLGQPLARVALGPVGLQLHALGAILKRLIVLLEGGVAG
mmetsp:Transcript_42893/g.127116  ORF Transcript_42893/g.127116 Transcript_42893/m.127116 type:complete len:575 (-) Transcript_42893:207-1931(-)